MASPGAPALLVESPDSLVQLAELDAVGEVIDARRRLLTLALGEVGDQDPNRYYRIAAPQFADGHHEHDTAWCGIFALAMLRQAGIVGGPEWLWRTGHGFVNNPAIDGRPALPRTGLPQAPGDIVVFGAPTWHHAIVYSWAAGKVTTIDGNTLPAPREGVAVRQRPLSSAFGYYSLARLLGE